MGRTSDEYGKGITVDNSGNVYTTGYFLGTVDFDPGTESFNLTSAGNDDIFIHKLSGSSFPWPMFIPATIGKSVP
ncbi:MAG: SBBP repeat-containing protein [Proteobacteria bacterium]|nr:SBBP repeat-containing protein [Pseudomonadota bacterium]MBU1418242.1 SBBP repeat-containing protein [Pseudomonadota bacterium]MBU1453354.1 SBBP repeat-containing protein [Pseudomonadota bacterium]